MHYLEKNELHHIAGGMSLEYALKLATELAIADGKTQEDAMRLAVQIEKATDADLPWILARGKDKWIFK